MDNNYSNFNPNNNDSTVADNQSNKDGNNIFCSNCGNKLQPNEKFCVKCGKEIEESDNIQCEQCGAILAKDAKFCNSCGASVIKNEKAFCPFCGEKYSGDGMFCKKCGHKITKSDNLFDNILSHKNGGGENKDNILTKIFASPIAKLQAVAIGLVVLMFIFSMLPAFVFKVNKKADQYTKFELNSFEKLSEELNERVKLSIFNPFASLGDYEDEIDGLSDSGIKEYAEIGDALKTAYIFSIIGAIIQAIAFAFVLVVFILPKFKPLPAKLEEITPIVPIVYAFCSIVYSIVSFAVMSSGVKSLQTDLGALGTAGMKLSFGAIAWIYLLLAIALLAVSVLVYKKNKENAQY